MTCQRESVSSDVVPILSTKRDTAYLALICLVASLGGLLFGFDTAVISGTVKLVQMQFGLGDLMVGWFASSALVGCIIGAAIAGWLGDTWGRKPVLLLSSLLFLSSALFAAIPPSFSVLVAARALGGLGVGLASVMAPLYISEFSPPKWRGRLVTFYQLSIVLGILLAYLSNWLILRFSQTYPYAFDPDSTLHCFFIGEIWRGMFLAAMIPATAFCALLFRVPESPRWLIKVGRIPDGLSILARIGGSETAGSELSAITASLSREEGTFIDLFRPRLRTALMVAVMLSVFGQLSGVNIVVYYGPKILAAAGYRDVEALLGQVSIGLINLVFTVIAFLMIDRLGRRPLLIGGMGVVTLSLVGIATLFLLGADPSAASDKVGELPVFSKALGFWIGVLIGVYIAAIASSICAVIWVLTPEIFPNQVRGRGSSIATFANWSTNALSALLFPWYSTNFGMSTAFFTAAAICFAATLFFRKFVPETKGRSLEDIESVW